MPYKVKAWIPCEEEDVEVYGNEVVADSVATHCKIMQPENIYIVAKCNEKGEDID